MSDPILPAFLRHPSEAMIIGRLLAGYGELEFDLSHCLEEAYDSDTAIKAMYRTRGEKQRIEIADALMRTRYEGAGVGGTYSEAIADLHHCRKIRNQYAHCHWVSQPTGLMFAQLEPAAQQHQNLRVFPRRIDLALIQSQEAYFRFVQECLWHIREAYLVHHGKLKSIALPLPKKLPRPPLYNP